MFYLVGLGLGDVKDVSVKGLEIIRKCDRVYLEAYTSILCHGPDKEALEEFYGRPVIMADRDMVEQGSDAFFEGVKDGSDVAVLVVGDPFGATTHSDLVLRAKQKDIPVKVIHNASIMNAVGCSGLQLYHFGETVSLCLWSEGWEPDSYFDKILANHRLGLHTLCLLDIKVKEQTVENLIKGRKIFEPPRYMTCAQAAEQLLTIIDRKKENGSDVRNLSVDTTVVGLGRIGWDDQRIVSCSLTEMSRVDLGPPLHSLIVCGNIHPMEQQYLETHGKP